MKSNYYNTHADKFIEDTVNVDMSSLHQRFHSYLPKGARVLDAGCGSGRDAFAFMEMGYSVDAFDASLEMVKYASQLTGLPIKHQVFEELKDVELYDGIWCCASLLHVPRNNLLDVMQVIANALKDKGVWYLSFKYGNEEREKDGRHFTDITEASLNELVSKLNGVKIMEMWVDVDQRPDNTVQWLNALLCKTEE